MFEKLYFYLRVGHKGSKRKKLLYIYIYREGISIGDFSTREFLFHTEKRNNFKNWQPYKVNKYVKME